MLLQSEWHCHLFPEGPRELGLDAVASPAQPCPATHGRKWAQGSRLLVSPPGFLPTCTHHRHEVASEGSATCFSETPLLAQGSPSLSCSIPLVGTRSWGLRGGGRECGMGRAAASPRVLTTRSCHIIKPAAHRP